MRASYVCHRDARHPAGAGALSANQGLLQLNCRFHHERTCLQNRRILRRGPSCQRRCLPFCRGPSCSHGRRPSLAAFHRHQREEQKRSPTASRSRRVRCVAPKPGLDTARPTKKRKKNPAILEHFYTRAEAISGPPFFVLQDVARTESGYLGQPHVASDSVDQLTLDNIKQIGRNHHMERKVSIIHRAHSRASLISPSIDMLNLTMTAARSLSPCLQACLSRLTGTQTPSAPSSTCALGMSKMLSDQEGKRPVFFYNGWSYFRNGSDSEWLPSIHMFFQIPANDAFSMSVTVRAVLTCS